VADYQRSKVYAAEQMLRRQMEFAARGARKATVFGSTITLPLEVRFGSIDAVRSYLDQIMQTRWYRDHGFNTEPVKVRRRKGEKFAHYEPDTQTIALHYDGDESGWAMREIVVLHELTHHSFSGHGPDFAKGLWTMVSNAIGPEVGLLLAEQYEVNGVDWN
jgi:putative metallohydrolase (TIGR04338 family)